MGHAFECEYCESFHTATDGCEEYERRRKKLSGGQKMSYDKDFWDFAYEAFSAMRYTAIAVALTEKGELFDNSRLHTLQGLEWAVDTLKDNIIPYGEWSEDRDDTVLRLHRKTSGFIQGIIEIEVQNRLS